MRKFTEWLREELNRQGLRATDLAKESGLAASTISRIINGQTTPSDYAYTKIAQALGQPIEKVLIIAGRIPQKTEDVTVRDIIELVNSLPIEERREILRYADYRYKEHKRRRDSEDDNTTLSANARS